MIPSRDKAKYKPLVRLRADVWKTLQKKRLLRKKWRYIIGFLNKRKKYSKAFYNLINYQKHAVSKFPVYNRYRYQKDLFLRLHIKLIYGRLQDYKIKKISSKKQYVLSFAQELEQCATTFLYRSKLVSTYGEARLHHSHKRILINGTYKQTKIKKGDVLHFSPSYEKVLKRRICKNFYNRKRIKYGINGVVDFDINTLRFLFHDNIKYFKNHPFKLPFERVIRWYTHV